MLPTSLLAHVSRSGLATTALDLLLLPNRAHAQPRREFRTEGIDPRWLLLPSNARHDPGGFTQSDMERFATALRNAGIYVLAFDEARALFAARESAEHSATSQSDIDIVAERAQAALLHVATGEHEKARVAIAQVLSRAEKALESLNRKTDSARHVLNACLYLVRAMIESGAEDQAQIKVRECRRLVPDIAPDPYDHPPKVMRLVKETEKDLATERSASLTIESRPTQCNAFVNGRKLGRTPYVISSLPPGEYRVQVECDKSKRGRVHRVTLGAESTRLLIDARFDRIVSTDRALTLKYIDREEENLYRLPDGVRAAGPVGAEEVLIITPLSRDIVRIDRIEVKTHDVLASAFVNLNAKKRERARRVAQAALALHRGESIALLSEHAERHAKWVAPPIPDDAYFGPRTRRSANIAVADSEAPKKRRKPRYRATDQQRYIGYAALGAGIAMLAGSWYAVGRLGERGDEFNLAGVRDIDYLTRQNRFDTTSNWVWGLSAAGTAATIGSMPFILPETERVRKDGNVEGPALGIPWWSWAAGAVGLGLVGVGGYQIARPADCVDIGCTRREPFDVVGGSLIMHGGALLSVPATHLVRHLIGPAARRRTDREGSATGRASGGANPSASGSASASTGFRLPEATIRLAPGGASFHISGAL